jgi:hypothetical protein
VVTYTKRRRAPERADGRDRTAYYKAYYEANKDRLKAKRKPAEYRRGEHYLRKYGVTEEWYLTKLAEQKGVCAICGQAPKKYRLHIDHDHATGAVRGLLCAKCNSALHVLENPAWMATANTYLEEHKPCPPNPLPG